MQDHTDELRALAQRLSEADRYLDLEGLRKRLGSLEAEASRPDLWDDADAARKVTTELSRVKGDVDELEGLASRLSDVETLYQLAVEEGDESFESEVVDALASVSGSLDELELRSLFSGEHDELEAVCEIHAGAGGTDAQDWAEMMLRMYLRWAERRGFGVELDEVSAGQEAGILSATFIVKGRYAYGLLTGEKGVHRLVRMSPFDAQHRRQTSFASFSAVPFLEDAGDEVEIEEKDLRVDTYRSSGAGGQHVNVTDSAVRLTHLPTGVVVAVQNERSQHQNKAKAMQILGMKLAELQREQRKAELDAISGPQTEVGWGQAFRHYVLAPYQSVKDDRTGHETGNVDAVLDGDLDPFMEAFLRWRRRDGAA
ncbi:MAG TPA: peptide chain release factor 2 [Acidimicrobiales bacterium]|jgi:peptide chain release factor 2|nr:peptide chain release factor 2 [Acidimicrobiales bacterium]